MKPKDLVEKLKEIYEAGGDEALNDYAQSNPVEYLQAIEAIYIDEGDDEGLEEFRAAFSRELRDVVDEHLTKDGFAAFDEMLRLARDNDQTETADRIEAYLNRLRQ